ncbi:MAG: peptide deformylase [Pseudomonadota bacterium]
MKPRPFIMYPDPRLRSEAAPLEEIDDAARALWDEMLAAMYAMPGVGLAANQLGVLRRLIVLDASDTRDQAMRLANPVILHESIEGRTHQEGSPNLPGLWAEVTRPRAVTVSYMDEEGAAAEREFVGLWATSVQHQIDHINGKLFIDHLSPMKRRMLVARYSKQMKQSQRKRG